MKDINITIKQFFSNQRFSGTVLRIEKSVRPNFEKLQPTGDGNLNCLSVHVMLDNLSIFGEEGPFLTNIFPRYQYLCNELTKYLTAEGFSVNNPDSTLSVSIIPYPNPKGYKKESLPIFEHYSRGEHILNIEELGKYSPYYKALGEEYKIKYGVMTTNKTVIGPDGGLIAAACSIADTYKTPISVLELGSGSGTTPYALLLRNKLKSYDGNDFSPEMCKFFHTDIEPKLKEKNIPSTLFQGSCYDYKITQKVDLLSLGIFYEGQPDIFNMMGKEMADAVGNTGALIIQSGMLENTFTHQLLFDVRTNHAYWPWYNKNFCVKNYFNYVAEVNVEDEIIVMATNNYDKFTEILKGMSKKFAIVNIDIVDSL